MKLKNKIFCKVYAVVFTCEIEGQKYYLTENYELSANPMDVMFYSPEEAGELSAILEVFLGGLLTPNIMEAHWNC